MTNAVDRPSDDESGIEEEDDEVSTDVDHSVETDTDSDAWRLFEHDVEALVRELDPGAIVTWNTHLIGELSGRRRQIDVLAEGVVAGEEFRIAVECKRYKRKVGIGTVDAFAGFLADIGVDRGVLYGFSGVGAGARARAEGNPAPRIKIRDLVEVDALDPWPDIIDEFIEGTGCPTAGCWGDVGWGSWPLDDEFGEPTGQDVEVGSCGWCGQWAIQCVDCGEVIAAAGWGTEECSSCGRAYSLIETPGDAGPTSVSADPRLWDENGEPIGNESSGSSL